ncbi:MAG: leucine-rich repeat protein [Muribaculaceae bacterium]|nr:leucine-rich repeat protein [Muribaculaceae bacterium]
MKKFVYIYALGAAAILASGGALTYAALALPRAEAAAPRSDNDAITPLAPAISAEFRVNISDGSTNVMINVTAPSEGRDSDWNKVELSSIDRLILCRSKGYEDDVAINVWDNIHPGENIDFEDNAPLSEGEEYTYTAYAVCKGAEGSKGYAYVTFGVCPIRPDAPELESTDGYAPVRVKFSCPDAVQGDYWNSYPFPEGVEYSMIELFKQMKQGEEIILFSKENPTPGEEYEYIDENPDEGANYYCVRTSTPYGRSEYSIADIYVGDDYPDRVSNLSAVDHDGVITLTWEAPEKGYNGGRIDPDRLYYKIYRLDNDYGRNPELRADDVTQCRFVDDLSDLTEEQTVYYRVYACNDVEAPENTYNYADTRNGILAGPPAPLPFRETFNSGSKWNKVTDNSWVEDFDYYTFNTHYLRNDVTVEYAGGEQSLSAGTGGEGNEETGADAFYYVTSGAYTSSSAPGYLTSGNLSMANASNPILTFHYATVPGCTGEVAVEMATAETDDAGEPLFETLRTHCVGLDADGKEVAQEDGVRWTALNIPLTGCAGMKRTKIRFRFCYPDPDNGRYPIIIDDIAIDDYPGVTNLTAEYDQERIILSWQLPESAGEKSVGYDVILNGRMIDRVDQPGYRFENPEQGETYTFAVATRYENDFETPIAYADPVSIPLAYFTVGDFTYNVKGDEVTVFSFDTAAEEAVVPSEVTFRDKIYQVTAIYPSLFSGHRQLRNVEILADVEEIPGSCFYGCTSLVSFKVPESVTALGDKAFFGCGRLKECNIAPVASIGDSAFENCIALERMDFGENLTEIGNRAFAGCRSLAAVTFASKVPPSVGDDAFSGIHPECTGQSPDNDAYAEISMLSPIHFPTSGIIMLPGMEGEVEYYSISGQPLSAPEIGMPVIVRRRMANGSVRTDKIIMR